MKIHCCRSTPKVLGELDFTVASLGVFDGLHIGHQSLIQRMLAVKDQYQGEGALVRTLLLSFYPHPAVVLGKATKVGVLTGLRKKVQLLDQYGIDIYLLKRFSHELANLPAEEFINGVLLEQFRVKHLIVGKDAAVGRDRLGTVDVMEQEFKKGGGVVEVMQFECDEGKKIGSAGIRELVRAGELYEAETHLGRKYSLEGRIIRGDGRGKGIGVPTANLHLGSHLIPPNGVYATKAILGDTMYPAVTNIGVRPTFSGKGLAVETHLLGYSGPDCYGERLEVVFLDKIRDEKRFGSPDELKEQIDRDIEQARKLTF